LWLVAVTTPFGGLLADRSGRHITVLLATATLLALGLLVAAHTADPLVAFAALGLIAGLPAGPIMSLPSRVLQPHTRTMGMAIYFTMFFVVQAAGPWIAGRVAAATGTVSSTFDVGAAFLVIGMVLVTVFLRLADAAQAKSPATAAA
jgi:predicted MFS family arabinose efflux permease